MSEPKERPIIFSGPMVRAILDGRKTQTRRVVKPHYQSDEYGFQVCTCEATGERWIEKYNEDEGGFDSPRYVYPPWKAGDRLWVRETWCPYTPEHIIDGEKCAYKVDATPTSEDIRLDYVRGGYPYKWRPSIHMPHWASRITLEVTNVKIEQIKNITLEGAKAEGFELTKEPKPYNSPLPEHPLRKFAQGFAEYWDELNAKRGYSWDSNPWVWVIEFRRIKP